MAGAMGVVVVLVVLHLPWFICFASLTKYMVICYTCFLPFLLAQFHRLKYTQNRSLVHISVQIMCSLIFHTPFSFID